MYLVGRVVLQVGGWEMIDEGGKSTTIANLRAQTQLRAPRHASPHRNSGFRTAGRCNGSL